MTPIARYGLETHSGPYESWPSTSALYVDGQRTRARVPGYVVHAQYESPLGNALVISFGCLFEESKAFVLLDGAGSVVWRTELGVPYGSFVLNEHWAIDASAIGLHYREEVFFWVAGCEARSVAEAEGEAAAGAAAALAK